MPPCGGRLKRPGKIVDSGKMDTMSNESPVAAAHDLPVVEGAPPASRLVEQVDRFFFVVWLGIYALLPTSGWASVMFASWLDQKRDLAALRSVISVGHADAIAHNGIGPAYIAAARIVHEVLRLSPEDSLVLLTKGSYALSVALGVVLVRVLAAPADGRAADGHHRRPVRIRRARLRGRDVALVGRAVEPLLRGLPRRRRVRGAVRPGSAHDGVRRGRRCRARAALAHEELRVRRARARLGHRARAVSPRSV